MSVEITCPVCDRAQINQSICPNCETDLSVYGMLANLPIQTPIKIEEKKRMLPIWLPIGVAILFLLLGLGLGFASSSVIAKQESQNVNTEVPTSISIPEKEPDVIVPKIAKVSQEEIQPQSNSCGGFKYVVRKGDSLSLIASRFYGDSNSWLLISEANSAIQGTENEIKIGDLLLVPNLKKNCSNI